MIVRGVPLGAVYEYSLPAEKLMVQTLAAQEGVGFAVIAAIAKVAPSVAPMIAIIAINQVRIETFPLRRTYKSYLTTKRRSSQSVA